MHIGGAEHAAVARVYDRPPSPPAVPPPTDADAAAQAAEDRAEEERLREPFNPVIELIGLLRYDEIPAPPPDPAEASTAYRSLDGHGHLDVRA